MSKDTLKEWKRFEHKTKNIVEKLNPKFEAFENINIEGKLSKTYRQVDLQLIDPKNYDFIAFECKDHKRSIDTPKVEAFVTKLEDIGAKKGAIVSNSPYTQGAKNMAKAKNIDLLHIISTEDSNIRTRLYAPLIYSDIYVKSIQLVVGTSYSTRGTFTQENNNLLLTSGNEKPETATNIFMSLWNADDTPLAHAKGNYIYKPPIEDKFMFTIQGEKIPLSELEFHYEVGEKHYMAKIEIIDTEGIYNVNNETYQTKSMTTEAITPYNFQNDKNEITQEQYEELKHKVPMRLSGVSLFGEN